jgi:DNA-binding NtrC family response regulator
MSGMDGIALCRRLSECRPDVPVLVITGFGSIETAVLAIRAGAYDYLTKPVEIEALALALERAITHHALKDEVRRLRRVVAGAGQLGEMVGRSDAMKRVYDLVERIAGSEATVLVTGESGTGKEVIARALHARSRRREGPFVAIHCAAVPEALIESELFGHARGAFTDAKTSRPGLFAEANGGTLLLDEIGELRCRRSRSCSGRSRSVERAPWAAAPRSRSTCASWPRRTAISSRPWRSAGSGRTCITGST